MLFRRVAVFLPLIGAAWLRFATSFLHVMLFMYIVCYFYLFYLWQSIPNARFCLDYFAGRKSTHTMSHQKLRTPFSFKQVVDRREICIVLLPFLWQIIVHFLCVGRRTLAFMLQRSTPRYPISSRSSISPGFHTNGATLKERETDRKRD